jgi:hypothetical protein
VKSILATLIVCVSLFGEAAEFRFFPVTGRTSITDMHDHAFHNPKLPPGVVAEYDGYQLFLIRTASNQKAAFLLMDYKKMLQMPKYLPNMGGFYGMDSVNKPNYVFAKGPFLAGVVGLDQEKADPVARTFAGRIPLQ